MKRWFFAFCSLLLVHCALFAQGGPPLITDGTGTPGDGRWEINCAFTVEKHATERILEAPFFDLNYGWGERIQLKWELHWLIRTTDEEGTKSGLGDSLVGVKWRFLDQEPYPLNVAVYPQLTFNNPTSSVERGLVSSGSQLYLPLVVSRSIGPLALDAEVGYNFTQNNTDEWIYGFVAAYTVSERLELVGEIHGATQKDLREEEAVFNLGARWKLTDTVSLLGSAGRSFRDSSSGEPQLLMYLGIQFNF